MTESSTAPKSAWRRFTAWLTAILLGLLTIAVGILVIPVSMQIFSRYTDLIPAYIWTEELARFLFIWMIMIGAMIGVRENTHFNIDIWPRLGPRATATLNLLAQIATLVFALVFVQAGWEFTAFAIYRTSELADLPLWLIHMAWPLTGLVWLIFLGEQFTDNLRVLRGRAPAPADTPVPPTTSVM